MKNAEHIKQRFVDLLYGTEFECDNCGYTSDDPQDEFDVTDNGNRDFKTYRCPECPSKFQAAFCSCGRRWACRQSFPRSQVKGDEQEVYKCTCGNQIHVHQRQ